MFSCRRMSHQLRLGAVLLAVLLPPANLQLGLMGQDAEGRREAALALHEIDVTFAEIDRIAPELNRIADEFSFRKDQWAGSPDQAVAFVRDATNLVPYRGSLRGSRGVLMDRRGNSLDRAILLAELLRRSGIPVKLCNATLAERQAAQLLATVRAFDSDSLRQDQARRVQLRGQLFAKTVGSLPTSTHSGDVIDAYHLKFFQYLDRRTKAQARRLQKMIGDPTTGAARERSDQAEALLDHWWVLYRRDQQWHPLDPTGLRNQLNLVAERQIEIDLSKSADLSVPPQLHHRIEIRVVIERWTGSEYQSQVALTHELFPSQVIGLPIVLSYVPRNWPADSQLQMDAAAFVDQLQRQTEWTPTLAIGSRAKSGKVFDDQGNVREGAGGGSPFDSLSQGLFGASKPKGLLTAVWVEYEIRVPKQAARIERRTICDLVAPGDRNSGGRPPWDARKATERALALSDSIEILPLVCNLDPVFIEHKQLDALSKNRELLKLAASGKETLSSEAKPKLNQFEPLPTQVTAFGVFRSLLLNAHPEAYLGSPNLITFHRQLQIGETNEPSAAIGLDIVFNQVELIPTIEDKRGRRLELGVMDTNLEAILLRDKGNVENTSEVFLASEKQNIDWKLIARVQQLDSLQLPDDVRGQMRTTIESGFAIAVPDQPVQLGDQLTYTWWRIDLQTGETLGIGRRGWGQSLTERLATNMPTLIEEEGYLAYILITTLIFKDQVFTGFAQAWSVHDPVQANALSQKFKDWHLIPETLEEKALRQEEWALWQEEVVDLDGN